MNCNSVYEEGEGVIGENGSRGLKRRKNAPHVLRIQEEKSLKSEGPMGEAMI